MKFLLHTIVPVNGKSVYYNVYHVSADEFYFEVLDNPNKMPCTNFHFFCDSLKCSTELPERELDVLSDLLRSHAVLKLR